MYGKQSKGQEHKHATTTVGRRRRGLRRTCTGTSGGGTLTRWSGELAPPTPKYRRTPAFQGQRGAKETEIKFEAKAGPN